MPLSAQLRSLEDDHEMLVVSRKEVRRLSLVDQSVTLAWRSPSVAAVRMHVRCDAT